MSVYALDKFLNNVFDVYATNGLSSDLTFTKDEYYITSDEKGWNIEMPLPGISKDNLKIDIEDNMLTIQAIPAIKSKATKAVKKSWYIDDSVDTGSIMAKLENVLLNIVLPRIKPNKKSVTVTVS